MKTVIAGALGECVHVAGVTNFLRLADHAATAADVIESCKLARRSIENALGGPDMTRDESIQKRVGELTQETAITLDEIRNLASEGVADPLADAVTLAKAIKTGILDAPQLKNNPFGRGKIATSVDYRGACIAVDPSTRSPISEKERIANLIIP
jgi:hypothetical protein